MKKKRTKAGQSHRAYHAYVSVTKTKTYRYDNRWNAILEETGTSTSGYIFVSVALQK